VAQAMVAVSARADLPVWIPQDVAGICCATPWSSKGFEQGHAHMAATVAEALLRWTEDGALPVVVDATSCTHGLRTDVPPRLDENVAERLRGLRIMDSIEWAHDSLLPALAPGRRVPRVVVHPPCAAIHLGLQEKLDAIAHALADEVRTPAVSTCCGMAGDRGLLHPELPHAALAEAAEEVARAAPSPCICSNRTCEIGLSEATGGSYGSFVLLLEELTRAA
jgi:D-lactate dehydrogenase